MIKACTFLHNGFATLRFFAIITFVFVLAALFWFQIGAKVLIYILTAAAVALFLAYVGHVWSRDEDEE